jgi:hypothetical protein
VSYDTAKAIDLSGSIGGVHTSIAVASGPAHGTTSVSGDVVTYTPTAGYFRRRQLHLHRNRPWRDVVRSHRHVDDCHACRADRVGGFGKREL